MSRFARKSEPLNVYSTGQHRSGQQAGPQNTEGCSRQGDQVEAGSDSPSDKDRRVDPEQEVELRQLWGLHILQPQWRLP